MFRNTGLNIPASKTTTIEKPYRLPSNMEGYAKLAHLMAKHEEFAIFRRFKALNYQALLYSQAEITHLEDELSKLVNKEPKGPHEDLHRRDWWTLAHSEDVSVRKQWRKFRRIRKRLDEYSKYEDLPKLCQSAVCASD